MILKAVYDFFIESFEHFNFKFWKFKVAYQYGKRLNKFNERRKGEVFKKKPNGKMRFQFQKHEKNLKSRIDRKMSLWAFNKELCMTNLSFSEIWLNFETT